MPAQEADAAREQLSGGTTSPWALQLAVRVERVDPPSVAAVCEAAAAAVLQLLDDERSAPGGVWHEAVRSWRDQRIRKLVRRARGAAWQRVQSVDGVTVNEPAEVRAFVPTAMDRIDDAVAKLQIDGRNVELAPPAAGDGRDAPPGSFVVALTPVVAMSWGKLAAQAAHGAQLLREHADAPALQRWEGVARAVRVIFPDAALWAVVQATAPVQVRDGGFTEIPPGTLTACAWFAPGPA